MRENEELWKELCALAAIEQDPERLLELTAEINRLLQLAEINRLLQLKEQRVTNAPNRADSKAA